MHLTHITTFLQGGAGRIITDLALAQRQAGHQVCVVADAGSAEGYGTYPEYAEELLGGGVEYFTVRSTFTRDVGLNMAAAAELRRLPAAAEADVVHAHAAIPALIGRMMSSGAARHVPVVSTMHGWGIRKTAEQAATDVAVLNQADIVTVPSRAAQAHLLGLGVDGRRIRTIPYGLGSPSRLAIPDEDLARIAGVRRRVHRVAVCIGTIGDRKNQRLIVDALADAPELSVGCIFIGDGDVAGLNDYIQCRGVWSRAVVLGPRRQASRYLSQADALILMSRNEGLPLAILEALRDGTAVVASAIPEIREVFATGAAAWLAAVDDPDDLRAALTALCNETTAALRSRAARNTMVFRARYDGARMVDAYDALYRSLRPRQPARRRVNEAQSCRA